MRKILLILGILLSTSICLLAGEVQSLVVQPKTGSESVHTLSGVRKIIFSGGTMSVVKKDASRSDYTLNNVQKLLFALRSATDISEVSISSLRAYPNPSTNLLFVEGVNLKDNVHLYDLKGNKLKISFALVNNILQVNTSILPQGLYLLQVNNQRIKIQKQ